VVCGPGSIAQAHQPDEWIAASQLQAADRFMQSAGAWALSGATDRSTTPTLKTA